MMVLSDRPSEAISNVPYLDAVIEEAMRFGQPYINVERTATRDCVVPLRNPVKGQNGKVIESVAVRKGTDIEVRKFFLGSIHSSQLSTVSTWIKPSTAPMPTSSAPSDFWTGPYRRTPRRWASHGVNRPSFGEVAEGARESPQMVTPGIFDATRAFNYALATNKAIVFAMVRSFVLSEPEGQTLVRTHGRVILINGKPSTEIPFICTPR